MGLQPQTTQWSPGRTKDPYGADKTLEATEEGAVCLYNLGWEGCVSRASGARAAVKRGGFSNTACLSVPERMLCDKQMCLSQWEASPTSNRQGITIQNLQCMSSNEERKQEETQKQCAKKMSGQFRRAETGRPKRS